MTNLITTLALIKREFDENKQLYIENKQLYIRLLL